MLVVPPKESTTEQELLAQWMRLQARVGAARMHHEDVCARWATCRAMNYHASARALQEKARLALLDVERQNHRLADFLLAHPHLDKNREGDDNMSIQPAHADDILEFPTTGEAYFRHEHERMGDAAPLGEPTVYTRDHPLYEQRARELNASRTGGLH